MTPLPLGISTRSKEPSRSKFARVAAGVVLAVLTLLGPAADCGAASPSSGSVVKGSGSETARLLTQRAREGHPQRVVLDVLFAAVFDGHAAADIGAPLSLAATVSKTQNRRDLQLLCKAAARSEITLPIPGANKDVREFQRACRRFQSARRAAQPPQFAIAELSGCEASFRALGLELATAVAQRTIAEVYLFRLSRRRIAEQNYEAVLAVFGRYGMDVSLACVYDDLAYSYQEQGLFETAQATYLEAGQRLEAAGRYDKASESYLGAAQLSAFLGEKELARTYVNRASNIARRHFVLRGNPTALVRTLVRGAGVMSQIDELDLQTALLREALSRLSTRDGLRLKESVLEALANALTEQGKTDEAKRARSDAEKVVAKLTANLEAEAKRLRGRGVSRNIPLGHCLSQLAWAYERQGLFERAAAAYAKAAALWESAGQYRRAIDALQAGRACAGKLPERIKPDSSPELIAERAERWELWDVACSELLELARDCGDDKTTAEKRYDRAVAAAGKSMDDAVVLDALQRSARFLLTANNTGKAEEQLTAAVAVSKRGDMALSGLTELYSLVAGVKEAKGDRQAVLSTLEDWAERALSWSRNHAGEPRDPSDPRASVKMMSRLMEEEYAAGRAVEAAAYAARFRGDSQLRSLYAAVLDSTTAGSLDLPAADISTPTPVASGRAQAVKWFAESISPVAGKVSGGGRDLGPVLRTVEALPKGVAYVQYIVTGATVYAFVARGASMDVVLLGDKSLIDEAVGGLRQATLIAEVDVASGLPLGARSSPKGVESDGFTRELFRLYDVLVKPIMPLLSGVSGLVVELPSEMAWVPIHAIASPQDGKHIMEEFAVSYLRPNIAGVGRQRSKDTDQSRAVEIFVGPAEAVPVAEDEIAAIVRAFPRSRVRRVATASEFALIVKNAGAIHIAAHYTSTYEAAVKLDGPGCETIITKEDVYGLRSPNLDLVTLSCCESAGGIGFAGESPLALADAFGMAGANSVVATLWRVSDKACAVVMGAFYKALAAGQSKAEALRSAQLSLKQNPKFSHPFYWAAFVLFGDPS